MQLVETPADMHSCSQLTMAASSSSLLGTSPSEAEAVDKVTRGTLILHNVITTTIDKQKCDRSSKFVVCIKHICYGGLVGMRFSPT